MPTTVQALADRLFPVVSPMADEAEVRNIPPEQRRLHTETADLTVGSLHHLMASGKIEIPEFQRGYVWTRTQASRLIESLIIQCPIPVVYFSQASNNNLVVIDGNQRLMTVKLYINDAFELQGLTTYPELNGYTWSQLDPRFRDHILNRTIRCITILKDTHPQIKFDVFERLNTGSVKLNAQELRHGVNHGSLMKRIDHLVKDDQWKSLSRTGSDKRMKGAELVLRFIAFYVDRDKYVKPLSGFLDTFSSANRNPPEELLGEWTRAFHFAVDQIGHFLGKKAFKMIKNDLSVSGSFNSAIYDAQMIGFACNDNPRIKDRLVSPEAIQAAYANLLHEERYLTSVQRATSDEAAVAMRLRRTIDVFNGL